MSTTLLIVTLCCVIFASLFKPVDSQFWQRAKTFSVPNVDSIDNNNNKKKHSIHQNNSEVLKVDGRLTQPTFLDDIILYHQPILFNNDYGEQPNTLLGEDFDAEYALFENDLSETNNNSNNNTNSNINNESNNSPSTSHLSKITQMAKFFATPYEIDFEQQQQHPSSRGFLIRVTTSHMAFTLNITTADDVFSSRYEEVTHERRERHNDDSNINGMISVDNYAKHINVATQLNKCLFNGYVVGHERSSVSITTCSGLLKGWILLNGCYWSIEPNDQQHLHYLRRRRNPQSALIINTQRDTARRGDLVKLLDMLESIKLVDSNAEMEYEMEQMKANGQGLDNNADSVHMQHDQQHNNGVDDDVSIQN